VLSKIRTSLTYANVMSTFALCIALGGGAYAATKLPSNSVGAKQIRRNAVGSSEVKDHSLRAKDFKRGELPAAVGGAGGAAGGQGPPGPPGAPATRYFATVDTLGYLTQGNAASASLDGTGLYTVRWNANLTSCSAVVTPGFTVSGDARITDTVAAAVGRSHAQGGGLDYDNGAVAVFVVRGAGSGTSITPDNSSFHIAVFC
jgi:hypothetical protein